LFVSAEKITLECKRCKKKLQAIKACKASGDCVYINPISLSYSRKYFCEKCELPYVGK